MSKQFKEVPKRSQDAKDSKMDKSLLILNRQHMLTSLAAGKYAMST